MFRRRTAPPPAVPAPPGPSGVPAASKAPSASAAELAEAGWILPRGAAAPGGTPGGAPAWTLVGTVGSPVATPVDPAGLVVRDGWSLDWWIGADDRWHLPPVEAAVRQDLVGDAPLVETLLRIPGGDAAHRAFGIRAPRLVGDEWVVIEIENRTPVPLAAALVLRPFVAGALGSVGEITIEPVEGGRGREVSHLVRVDGRPALVLPRRPARTAVGSAEAGDVVEALRTDGGVEELLEVRCPDGLATAAFVFPVPHTAVLRIALPVGDLDPSEPIAFPSVVPDASTVASGWDVHRRGPRFEIPERRLHVAVERARAQVHLAHDGSAVRRDGERSPDIEPGATQAILAALDLLDRPAEVGPILASWQGRLADPTVQTDTAALAAISHHWLVHRIDALRDWMLPEVAAAIERLDRADRKGRLTDPGDRARARRALLAAARLLGASDQADAAAAVAELAARIGDGAAPSDGSAFEELVIVRDLLEDHDPAAPDRLDAVLATASTTGAWPGPGPDGRAIGQDLAAAAALVVAARHLLVHEVDGAVELLPVFPAGWYGGAVEAHDVPTSFGTVSYAIRWHGTRPALLWDVVAHEGIGPVRLTVPGLDPTWSTTEAKGEALLAEVAPPADLDLLRLVPDHPDILPEMRKPGEDPGPPPPTLPEGGTFS